MARRRKSFGAIKRSRSKVRAAARRFTSRSDPMRGPVFYPEDAARKFPMKAEVYRRHDGLYQGWVCFASGNRSGRLRAGHRCGEAKGRTPTDALAKAAHDFARTLKSR